MILKWIFANWFKITVIVLLLLILSTLKDINSSIFASYDLANYDAEMTRDVINDASSQAMTGTENILNQLTDINNALYR